jgi:phage tail protein X
MVVTVGGDTLQTVAQRVYGNASLWYVIADANNLEDPNAGLTEGIELKTPAVQVTSNNASTLKPYDPNSAIGSTTPSLPYILPPPSPNYCYEVAAVLTRAVGDLLAPFTYGVSAAVGETIAEKFENWGHLRNGYDVGTIAMAGVNGYLGGDTYLDPGPVNSGLTAVINDVGATAIDKALGRPTHFSWKSVAVDAVEQAASYELFGNDGTTQGQVNQNPSLTGGFNWKAAVEAAGESVANAGIRYGLDKAIIGKAQWSWGQVGAQALGQGLVAGLTTPEQPTQASQAAPTIAESSSSRSFPTFTTGQIDALIDQSSAELFGTPDLSGLVLDPSYALADNSHSPSLWSRMNGSVVEMRSTDPSGVATGNTSSVWLKYQDDPSARGSRWSSEQDTSSFATSDGFRVQAGQITFSFDGRSLTLGASTATLGPPYGDTGDHGNGFIGDLIPSVVSQPAQVVSASQPTNYLIGRTVLSDDSTFTVEDEPMTLPLLTVPTPQADSGGFWSDAKAVGETGLGIVAGAAKTVIDIADGIGEFAVNVGGAADYELSGGEYGAEQYEALGNGVAGLVQTFEHPVDTVSKGVGQWYTGAVAAYNRDDFIDYGMRVGGGATTAALTLDGGIGIAKTTVAGGAAILKSGSGVFSVPTLPAAGDLEFGAPQGEVTHGVPDSADAASAAARVELRNGYQYEFDGSDRVSSVEGDLVRNPSQGRNRTGQLNAGGEYRLPDDQGGHFIGRRFDGPLQDFNHFAQNGNFNMGAYRSLEDSWSAALDEGSSVRVRIEPSYPGESLRPDTLRVQYWIDGAPNEVYFYNRPGGR